MKKGKLVYGDEAEKDLRKRKLREALKGVGERFAQPGYRERIAEEYQRILNEDHGAPEGTPLIPEDGPDELAEFLERLSRSQGSQE